MKRFCGFPPTPEFTGDLEEMSLLAGEIGWSNQATDERRQHCRRDDERRRSGDQEATRIDGR